MVDISIEQKIQAVKQFVYASWILTPILVALAAYHNFAGANVAIVPILLLGFIQLLSSTMHWFLLKKYPNPISVQYYTWTHSIITLFMMTAAIHYTGGILSPFSWLYILSIVLEIMLLTPQKGIGVAFSSMVLYSALIISEFNQWIVNSTAWIGTYYAYYDFVFVFSHLLSTLSLIAIVTFLIGVLKIQLRDREQETQSLLENVQREMEQTRKLLKELQKKK